MRIPIVNMDSVGIITDISPHDLPFSAWSAGRNVRMIDGRVEKMPGHKQSFPPQIEPLFLLPFQHVTGYWWLYASTEQIFAYQNGVVSDATRRVIPYNAAGGQWSGGILNGIVILSNPNDIPQQWVPGAGSFATDLAHWPTEWRTRNLKPFGNFLVALGTTKAGALQPYNVNWSHPAEPGTVPISWDIADPTKDAGEVTLADTEGFVVNQLTMGDVNLIYKEDSVYAMQYIGGNSIFNFKRLFKENIGLLMPNGLCSFTPPGRSPHHMVFAPNDIVVHDGRSITSVFEGKMRKWLYNNLDSDNFLRSFIVNNVQMKEIWLCFPLVGATWPNCALVWNYNNNTTTIRDLPSVTCGAVGQITEVISGQTQASWDADTGVWDADTSTWGSSAYQPVTSRLMMGSIAAQRKMIVMDLGTQFEDALYNSVVERTGLSVVGTDKTGKPIEDSEVVKLITEVWIRAQGNVGTILQCFVGTQDDRGSYPIWNGPYPFVIGVDKKINPLVSGRIVSVRFESDAASMWQLHGYDLELKPIGGY
jgi:hypothetical protein